MRFSDIFTGTGGSSQAAPTEVRARTGGTLVRQPKSLGHRLLGRLLIAILIIFVVTVSVYLGRDGINDNAHPDRPLTLIDSFYYAVTSITTVGYGDIAPESQDSRLFNAVFLTPVRLAFYVLFFGTAYELAVYLKRRAEERDIMELGKNLNNHAIICGYGTTGRAAAKTLIAQGKAKSDIVVIDRDQEAVQRATKDGVIAFLGDATELATLQSAAVHKAESVLVAPGRDDTAVLICLTVNDIEPDINLVAAGLEEENIKLLYQAGADRVIAPAVTGGRLLAAASESRSVPWYIEHLVGTELGGKRERVVTEAESGLSVEQLKDFQNVLVLGIARGNQPLICEDLNKLSLMSGDEIIYFRLGTRDGEPPGIQADHRVAQAAGKR